MKYPPNTKMISPPVILARRTSFASLNSDLPIAPFFSSPGAAGASDFFLNKFAVSMPNIFAIFYSSASSFTSTS